MELPVLQDFTSFMNPEGCETVCFAGFHILGYDRETSRFLSPGCRCRIRGYESHKAAPRPGAGRGYRFERRAPRQEGHGTLLPHNDVAMALRAGLCSNRGLTLTGTIGVLIKAKRLNLIKEVVPVIEKIRAYIFQKDCL